MLSHRLTVVRLSRHRLRQHRFTVLDQMPPAMDLHLQPYVDRFHDQSTQGKVAIVAGGVGAVALLGHLLFRRSDRSIPGTSHLSGGGINRDKVQSEFDQYSASYGKGAGEGITDRKRTTQLVDTFYNLVTGAASH